MCRTLRHRGPDDEGIHLRGPAALAVRRLAIVDVAGGHQPVRNEAGTVHAVVNGEIYNHVELRRDLQRRGHRFASGSDCEVVPHLYEEYGEGFATRLDGMFAVALWDEERRQLVLVRDRAGIKPLYYTVRSGRLIFGSEIRAILAAGDTTTLDPQALASYLSLMYIPGPRTIYAEIHKLEPGRTLVWRDGKYKVRRYWDLADVARLGSVSASTAKQTVRELLAESVEQHLMADVPVGFFLSGGIDSSSIVATARRLHPSAELKTFTIGFNDRSYDERAEAALVAQHLHTDHTELLVEPSADDVVDRIVPTFDEPFADPSMIATYYLCELARTSVTVALSGDGGDELFAGYLSYQADKIARYYRLLPRGLTAQIAPTLLRFLPASHHRASFDFKARRFVAGALEPPARSHYLWRVVLREEHKARLLQPDIYAGLVDSFDTHERHDFAGRTFDNLTRRAVHGRQCVPRRGRADEDRSAEHGPLAGGTRSTAFHILDGVRLLATGLGEDAEVPAEAPATHRDAGLVTSSDPRDGQEGLQRAAAAVADRSASAACRRLPESTGRRAPRVFPAGRGVQMGRSAHGRQRGTRP